MVEVLLFGAQPLVFSYEAHKARFREQLHSPHVPPADEPHVVEARRVMERVLARLAADPELEGYKPGQTVLFDFRRLGTACTRVSPPTDMLPRPRVGCAFQSGWTAGHGGDDYG